MSVDTSVRMVQWTLEHVLWLEKRPEGILVRDEETPVILRFL